jgi:hypothetical protein
VGFFDRRRPEPEDDEPDDEDELDEPRATYLGGVVPIDALVARSESAAVAVRHVVAYPDGFEFTVEVWVRLPAPRRRPWEPIMLELVGYPPGKDPPPEFLRFGIEFPDGATVTNLDAGPWETSPDATQPEHGMESQHGSGSYGHHEQTMWAWPVPDADDGVVAFVCEWPAYDIAETRYEIDAGELRRAAGRARAVWPDLTGPSHVTRSAITGTLSTQTMRSQRREAEE